MENTCKTCKYKYEQALPRVTYHEVCVKLGELGKCGKVLDYYDGRNDVLTSYGDCVGCEKFGSKEENRCQSEYAVNRLVMHINKSRGYM